MWWHNRIFFRGARRRVLTRFVTRYSLPVTFLLFLSACGFHAMYGENSGLVDTPVAGNLRIDPIGGHEGQELRIALEDKLNPEGLKSASPEYHLHIEITKSLIPSVVKPDGTVQRYDIQLNSTFKLIRTADKKTLLEGNIRRTGSYNVAVNANFATYEAEQNIITRTLQEMAEDYVLRISTFYAGKSS